MRGEGECVRMLKESDSDLKNLHVEKDGPHK